MYLYIMVVLIDMFEFSFSAIIFQITFQKKELGFMFQTRGNVL